MGSYRCGCGPPEHMSHNPLHDWQQRPPWGYLQQCIGGDARPAGPPIALLEDLVVLGRGPEAPAGAAQNLTGVACPLQWLPMDDDRVSRLHASVTPNWAAGHIRWPPLVSIEDHSRNGTFLNGVPLRPGMPTILSHGDRISLVLSINPLSELSYTFKEAPPLSREAAAWHAARLTRLCGGAVDSGSSDSRSAHTHERSADAGSTHGQSSWAQNGAWPEEWFLSRRSRSPTPSGFSQNGQPALSNRSRAGSPASPTPSNLSVCVDPPASPDRRRLSRGSSVTGCLAPAGSGTSFAHPPESHRRRRHCRPPSEPLSLNGIGAGPGSPSGGHDSDSSNLESPTTTTHMTTSGSRGATSSSARGSRCTSDTAKPSLSGSTRAGQPSGTPGQRPLPPRPPLPPSHRSRSRDRRAPGSYGTPPLTPCDNDDDDLLVPRSSGAVPQPTIASPVSGTSRSATSCAIVSNSCSSPRHVPSASPLSPQPASPRLPPSRSTPSSTRPRRPSRLLNVSTPGSQPPEANPIVGRAVPAATSPYGWYDSSDDGGDARRGLRPRELPRSVPPPPALERAFEAPASTPAQAFAAQLINGTSTAAAAAEQLVAAVVQSLPVRTAAVGGLKDRLARGRVLGREDSEVSSGGSEASLQEFSFSTSLRPPPPPPPPSCSGDAVSLNPTSRDSVGRDSLLDSTTVSMTASPGGGLRPWGGGADPSESSQPSGDRHDGGEPQAAAEWRQLNRRHTRYGETLEPPSPYSPTSSSVLQLRKACTTAARYDGLHPPGGAPALPSVASAATPSEQPRAPTPLGPSRSVPVPVTSGPATVAHLHDATTRAQSTTTCPYMPYTPVSLLRHLDDRLAPLADTPAADSPAPGRQRPASTPPPTCQSICSSNIPTRDSETPLCSHGSNGRIDDGMLSCFAAPPAAGSTCSPNSRVSMGGVSDACSWAGSVGEGGPDGVSGTRARRLPRMMRNSNDINCWVGDVSVVMYDSADGRLTSRRSDDASAWSGHDGRGLTTTTPDSAWSHPAAPPPSILQDRQTVRSVGSTTSDASARAATYGVGIGLDPQRRGRPGAGARALPPPFRHEELCARLAAGEVPLAAGEDRAAGVHRTRVTEQTPPPSHRVLAGVLAPAPPPSTATSTPGGGPAWTTAAEDPSQRPHMAALRSRANSAAEISVVCGGGGGDNAWAPHPGAPHAPGGEGGEQQLRQQQDWWSDRMVWADLSAAGASPAASSRVLLHPHPSQSSLPLLAVQVEGSPARHAASPAMPDTSRYPESSGLAELLCGLCGDYLRRAVAVHPCGHSFCADCLSRHLSEAMAAGARLGCPDRCAAFDHLAVNHPARRLEQILLGPATTGYTSEQAAARADVTPPRQRAQPVLQAMPTTAAGAVMTPSRDVRVSSDPGPLSHAHVPVGSNDGGGNQAAAPHPMDAASRHGVTASQRTSSNAGNSPSTGSAGDHSAASVRSSPQSSFGEASRRGAEAPSTASADEERLGGGGSVAEGDVSVLCPLPDVALPLAAVRVHMRQAEYLLLRLRELLEAGQGLGPGKALETLCGRCLDLLGSLTRLAGLQPEVREAMSSMGAIQGCLLALEQQVRLQLQLEHDWLRKRLRREARNHGSAPAGAMADPQAAPAASLMASSSVACWLDTPGEVYATAEQVGGQAAVGLQSDSQRVSNEEDQQVADSDQAEADEQVEIQGQETESETQVVTLSLRVLRSVCGLLATMLPSAGPGQERDGDQHKSNQWALARLGGAGALVRSLRRAAWLTAAARGGDDGAASPEGRGQDAAPPQQREPELLAIAVLRVLQLMVTGNVMTQAHLASEGLEAVVAVLKDMPYSVGVQATGMAVLVQLGTGEDFTHVAIRQRLLEEDGMVVAVSALRGCGGVADTTSGGNKPRDGIRQDAEGSSTGRCALVALCLEALTTMLTGPMPRPLQKAVAAELRRLQVLPLLQRCIADIAHEVAEGAGDQPTNPSSRAKQHAAAGEGADEPLAGAYRLEARVQDILAAESWWRWQGSKRAGGAEAESCWKGRIPGVWDVSWGVLAGLAGAGFAMGAAVSAAAVLAVYG